MGEGSTLDALRAELEALAGGVLPEWESLEKATRRIDLEANDVVFPVGISHPYLYIVRQGMLRIGTFAPNGQMWIIGFSRPGELVTSLPALRPIWLQRAMSLQTRTGSAVSEEMGEGRTAYHVTAVERTRLIRIDYRAIEALALRHIEWAHLLIAATLQFSLAKERRQRQFLTLTAEQRYRELLAQEPELVRRVPQKDLALHLGITPEGFSRLASRVRRADRDAAT